MVEGVNTRRILCTAFSSVLVASPGKYYGENITVLDDTKPTTFALKERESIV